MKPSARVALIVALAATTAPTWASLPFYSPDYTFDSTTGTGFKYHNSISVSSDGKAAASVRYYESNVELNFLSTTWRGQTPLPTPQGDVDHTNPRVSDINRSGWTCGWTTPPSDPDPYATRPAMWRPDGTRIDLPLFPTPNPDEPHGGSVYAMNDSGFVIGYSHKHVESGWVFGRPVYWTPSFDIVELSNPHVSHELWFGFPISISPNGVIAGNVYDLDWNPRAMRWDVDGTAPILSHTTDTGLTFIHSYAQASLDDGTIVGWGEVDNTGDHFGVLWSSDGEAIELRNLPFSYSPDVHSYDVNRSHYSVGRAEDSLGHDVAVRWSPTGEPLALDRLPDAPPLASDSAFEINDLNFVIGISYRGAYERVILWTPDGDAIDLNSLVDPNIGWKFAADDTVTITNTGWISGVGNFDPIGPAEAYRRPFSILVPFAGTYGMGDANFDESIDFADLLIVAQNYGTETNGSFDVGDFNLDGVVNFTDLLAIAQNYGDVLGDVFTMLPNSPNPTFESDWQAARGMVPEPSVTGLMIGVGLMLRRRVGPAPRLPNAPRKVGQAPPYGDAPGHPNPLQNESIVTKTPSVASDNLWNT